MIAITVMASLIPIGPLSAQTDGKPGKDSTPSDLREPIQPAPTPTTPTVPAEGAGGAEAVDLDPDVAQATKIEGTVEPLPANLTIAEIVAGSENFTTLTGALRAVDLTDTLKAEGQYTLLAPDNAAFAALPRGVLEALMKPENLPTLKKILSYHLISQTLKSNELVPGAFATAQGEPATVVGGPEGKVTIQEAKLKQVDIMGSNGMIHVIDRVLIPPSVSIKVFETVTVEP